MYGTKLTLSITNRLCLCMLTKQAVWRLLYHENVGYHTAILRLGTSGKFVILKFTNFQHFLQHQKHDHVASAFSINTENLLCYTVVNRIIYNLIKVWQYLSLLKIYYLLLLDKLTYAQIRRTVGGANLMSFNRNSINFVQSFVIAVFAQMILAFLFFLNETEDNAIRRCSLVC